MTALTYLSRLCLRWGGELITLPGRSFSAMIACHGVTAHPYGSHALHRGRRQIFVNRGHVRPGTVIHEMGHVFLEEADPSTTYEPDWLGWEIALARQARCYRTWAEQNAGYIFSFRGKEYQWGELPPQEERRFIANRLAHARRLGILSRNGTPLCTRQTRTTRQTQISEEGCEQNIEPR